MKSKEEKITFWQKQYSYCANAVSEYDNGKPQIPQTIQAFELGARGDALKEANYAADKLAELGVMVPKIV